MKTYQLAVLSAIALLSLKAEASNYPPGYAVERNCQRNGPIEVCAVNQHYGQYPRLNVFYKGSLLGESDKSAWIKLNGREGFYPLADLGSGPSLYLNEPVSYFCYVGGVPDDYQGPYTGCRYPEQHYEPSGYVTWEVNPIAEAETDLFFYARNQYGIANAWDIELAIVNAEGDWDSDWGQNYKFRFK